MQQAAVYQSMEAIPPVAHSSITEPVRPQFPPLSGEKRYLKPSVFWSIRQGFPRWLSLMIVAASLAVPLAIWALLSYAGWVPPMFLPAVGLQNADGR
jgi:NitT/TauT family transport system permease protein